jgi:hypothetical protein
MEGCVPSQAVILDLGATRIRVRNRFGVCRIPSGTAARIGLIEGSRRAVSRPGAFLLSVSRSRRTSWRGSAAQRTADSKTPLAGALPVS